MSAKFGQRFGANMRQSFQRYAQRRAQSTATSAPDAAANQSGFQKLWNSPIGPKTVHFWAPIMKVRLARPSSLFPLAIY